MIGGIYDTGTVAVVNGSTTVVGTGTFWPDVLEGDHLVIGGLLSLIASADSGTSTITLMKPYGGTTNATASYQIVKMSWLRYDPSTVMFNVRDFLSKIDESNTGLIYYTTGTPDPAIGENGDIAIDLTGAYWIFWRKEAGVWVLQPFANLGDGAVYYFNASGATIGDAIAALPDGGTLRVPPTDDPTLPSAFPGITLEYDSQTPFHFFGFGDVSSKAQRLIRSQPPSGTHVGENWGAVAIEHTASGSGGAGDSGDNGLMVSVKKKNWGSSALSGQIAAHYVRVMNDGPATGPSNDGAAYLFDIIGVHTSGYYSALEGNVLIYETDRSTLRKAMYCQALPCDARTGDTAIGMLVGPSAGVMDVGFLVQSIAGTSITHPFLYQTETGEKFSVDSDGAVVINGVMRLSGSDSYTSIFNPDGESITVGDTTDPINYYVNGAHHFYSRDYTTFYALIYSGGFYVENTVQIYPPGLNKGLDVIQVGGSGTLSADQNYNKIAVTGDATNGVPLSGNQTHALDVQLVTGGTGATGVKIATRGMVVLFGSTANNTGDDLIGVMGGAITNQPNGGTNTGAGAAGTLYGGDFYGQAFSGAINYLVVAGFEANAIISTGGSARHRWAASFVGNGDLRGAATDAAIEIGATSSAASHTFGIFFDNLHGGAPIPTFGTVMGTDGNSATVANCLDFHSYTFTGDILYFNTFRVTGAGDVSGNTFKAPLTTPASSAAAGVAGTIKWDANFVYVCTATNTWKRSALSTF
jgi:hypothetical protein